ncbi:hypothetical protein C8R42DRAFT_758135 [Lentinula raphanica]|nr:hypothetical protein C8R42DRAFT_758135 [Lentinula raphanica]
MRGFERSTAMHVKPHKVITKALLKSSSSLTMLSTSSASTLTLGSVPMSALPSSNRPRTLDLTGVSLTRTQAEILADVLSIEWGLRSLILCESNLDPEVLKPILHALLLNNTLIYLSVASNTGLGNKSLAGRGTGAGYGLSAGLKGAGVTITGGGGLGLGGIGGGVTGWVVLEAYLSKSRLKVLDLSRNAIDKRLTVSLKAVWDLQTPRAKPQVLPLWNLLRTTCSGHEAADTLASPASAAIPSARSALKLSSTITGSVPIQKPLLPLPRHPLPSSLNSSSHPNSHPPLSHLPPPPPSHSTKNVQMTYTPYVPRSKRGVVAGSGSVPATPTTPMAPMAPTLTTVSRGGVTAGSVTSDDSSSLNSSSESLHNYSASTITPTTINAITHDHPGSTLGLQPVPPSVAALNTLLDVKIPPGVEGYARLSREILNTCITNVEASEREEQEHGGGLVLGDVFNKQALCVPLILNIIQSTI